MTTNQVEVKRTERALLVPLQDRRLLLLFTAFVLAELGDVITTFNLYFLATPRYMNLVETNPLIANLPHAYWSLIAFNKVVLAPTVVYVLMGVMVRRFP